jgi:MFS transporter, DHA2 family, glioxin efflux transporter
VPVIVGQGISPPQDLASVTAMIIFFQTLSGAIWVSVGQSLFANKLVTAVPKHTHDVNPALVVATGATDLRKVFASSGQLPGVILAYLDGLKDAFILGIALAGAAFVVSVIYGVINYHVLPRGAEAEAVEAQAAEEQKEGHVV